MSSKAVKPRPIMPIKQGVITVRQGKPTWQSRLQFLGDSLLALYPRSDRPEKEALRLVISFFCEDFEANTWAYGHCEELLGEDLPAEENVLKATRDYMLNILPYVRNYVQIRKERKYCDEVAKRRKLRQKEDEAWGELREKLTRIVLIRYGQRDDEFKLNTKRIDLDKAHKFTPKLGKNARKRAERYAEIDAARTAQANEIRANLKRAFDAFFPDKEGRKKPPHIEYRERFEGFIRQYFVHYLRSNDPRLLDEVLGYK